MTELMELSRQASLLIDLHREMHIAFEAMERCTEHCGDCDRCKLGEEMAATNKTLTEVCERMEDVRRLTMSPYELARSIALRVMGGHCRITVGEVSACIMDGMKSEDLLNIYSTIGFNSGPTTHSDAEKKYLAARTILLTIIYETGGHYRLIEPTMNIIEQQYEEDEPEEEETEAVSSNCTDDGF